MTFEFGDVHHATFSPPMNSELSFCSTFAPPNTFTSLGARVMVGAPGTTGVGVGVGGKSSLSLPPQLPRTATAIHVRKKSLMMDLQPVTDLCLFVFIAVCLNDSVFI